MYEVDPIKSIQFTMEVATGALELLDLNLNSDKECKQISVDVLLKIPSFTYVLPSTCFLKNNISMRLKGFLR